MACPYGPRWRRRAGRRARRAPVVLPPLLALPRLRRDRRPAGGRAGPRPARSRVPRPPPRRAPRRRPRRRAAQRETASDRLRLPLPAGRHPRLRAVARAERRTSRRSSGRRPRGPDPRPARGGRGPAVPLHALLQLCGREPRRLRRRCSCIPTPSSGWATAVRTSASLRTPASRRISCRTGPATAPTAAARRPGRRAADQLDGTGGRSHRPRRRGRGHAGRPQPHRLRQPHLPRARDGLRPAGRGQAPLAACPRLPRHGGRGRGDVSRRGDRPAHCQDASCGQGS